MTASTSSEKLLIRRSARLAARCKPAQVSKDGLQKSSYGTKDSIASRGVATNHERRINPPAEAYRIPTPGNVIHNDPRYYLGFVARHHLKNRFSLQAQAPEAFTVSPAARHPMPSWTPIGRPKTASQVVPRCLMMTRGWPEVQGLRGPLQGPTDLTGLSTIATEETFDQMSQCVPVAWLRELDKTWQRLVDRVDSWRKEVASSASEEGEETVFGLCVESEHGKDGIA